MKRFLIFILSVAVLALGGCGQDLQQQVDMLRQANAHLAQDNQTLQGLAASLLLKINAYNQEQAKARAEAEGKERAILQEKERLVAFAPVCDYVPFLCSDALKLAVEEAKKSHNTPDPTIAIMPPFIVFAAVLGLVTLAVIAFLRLFCRFAMPDAQRVYEEWVFLSNAATARSDHEAILGQLRSEIEMETERLADLRLIIAGAQDVHDGLVAARAEKAAMEAECNRLRRWRDDLSGL